MGALVAHPGEMDHHILQPQRIALGIFQKPLDDLIQQLIVIFIRQSLFINVSLPASDIIDPDFLVGANPFQLLLFREFTNCV